jgi:hypothetical protein
MDRQVPLGAAIATALALLLSAPEGASAQIAVSANHNKVLLVDGERTVPRNPEPDTVTIIDLNGPKPKVIGQASSRSGLSNVDRRDSPAAWGSPVVG